MLYAKMRKESENEETRFFCQIFAIGGISIEGARGLLGHPQGTPMVLRQDRAL